MDQQAHPDVQDGPAAEVTNPPWRDPAVPIDARVADLLSRMTLEEKLAQLGSLWPQQSEGDEVAPHQDELGQDSPGWREATRDGIGQLTRTFGTHPVAAPVAARMLERAQRSIMATGRFGIPAMAHEECLAGFTAWGATAFPVPLSWGASFDPDLVREMGAAIGRSMREVGVHQGLAPVLDVVRDPRWGRVEETIGEDPYLVGSIGAAYTLGLESAGIVATPKHFAGYSASRAGRNLAPVSMGPREFADIILPPFEMALRLGGARSVMHAYTERDGVPAAADHELLTGILREQLGFTGVVVADYFGVAFLELLHGVADGPGDAAVQALSAGVDVELPTVRCYGLPLAEKVRSGALDESIVDTAATRVLRQKCELGLLDPDWAPTARASRQDTADFDPPHQRALARKLAEESVVLLSNPAGVLPLRQPGRVAIVGPLADDPLALLGCYSFPAHVGVSHPGTPLGIEIPTVLQAARDGLGADDLLYTPGCDVRDTDRSGFDAAREAATGADLCVVVLGDRPGLFGRGTSGEGCDAADLALPGVQDELLDALLATGTPVVLVISSGRPYALGAVTGRVAAAVQVFFPGEEGAHALVDVLTGRVNPSGRLPVSLPAEPGGQPATYLGSPLQHRSEVSSLDPTALFPFGHGLSYTSFGYSDLAVDTAEIGTDGSVEIAATVTNTGDRPGAEVVQLYLRDPVAQVVRPLRQLSGFTRVWLDAGESCRVRFQLHADRTSFTGRDGRRIVEPGRIEVSVGGSSDPTPLSGSFRLIGRVREVGPDRVLDTPVSVDRG
jgi:beta-xylosidase